MGIFMQVFKSPAINILSNVLITTLSSKYLAQLGLPEKTFRKFQNRAKMFHCKLPSSIWEI